MSYLTPTSRKGTSALAVLIAPLAVLAAVGSAAYAVDIGTKALTSRVMSLHEYAVLRVTRSSGSNIEARGKASGTLNGSLYVHIVVNSASKMSATLTGTGRSGSIRGRGSSHYYVSGSNSYYSGTVSISGGTGSYAHASANGIHIKGVMNRARRMITMAISGRMHV